MAKKTWIVGSRQSALALTQTQQVIEDLRAIAREKGLDYDFEVKKIVTRGDRILDVTLSKVGGKGLFVKEIEQAMYDKEIDFAIHSMKDMPAVMPEGLTIGCVPKREDPRDGLISANGETFDSLPEGARVGTSSLRRGCQLKHRRPDLQVDWIRGNIDSRLKKLEDGQFDAIVLAAAGLRRMGWSDRITQLLPTELCLPAVGQGALAIECRADDKDLLSFLALYSDEETLLTVEAERAYLAALNGGCQVPIGAYAALQRDARDSAVIELTGIVGSPDGATLLRETMKGAHTQELGQELAQKLLSQGAGEILAEVEKTGGVTHE